MFYLTYRPKTISEIDNSNVKEIVTSILSSHDLPHAYLFVGQKGTGKTSTARIFAKAINCQRNKFANKKLSLFEPCNICANCLSIDMDSSPDVIELDAASNRGIADIKKLIHESSFLPMITRYRVFIIDEAHMITPEGFNALLKTLEEPPSQVIFILATTNKEKVPKTIASRCILINFGKAQKKDIISMLKRIAKSEKLAIDPQLLDIIPQYSDYSFRDAAKILEELKTVKKLTFADGQKFLGLVRKSLLELMQKEDLKSALTWIDEYSASGGNFQDLITQLIDELRLALFYQSGINIGDKPAITYPSKEIITLMKLLSQAYATLRTSPIDSLPLEIAVVEFYNQRNAVKN